MESESLPEKNVDWQPNCCVDMGWGGGNLSQLATVKLAKVNNQKEVKQTNTHTHKA